MIAWNNNNNKKKKKKFVAIRVIFITVDEDKAFTSFEIDE